VSKLKSIVDLLIASTGQDGRSTHLYQTIAATGGVVDGPEPAEHPDPDRGGRRIRQGSIVAPATSACCGGLLQIELRIMAHLSG